MGMLPHGWAAQGQEEAQSPATNIFIFSLLLRLKEEVTGAQSELSPAVFVIFNFFGVLLFPPVKTLLQ